MEARRTAVGVETDDVAHRPSLRLNISVLGPESRESVFAKKASEEVGKVIICLKTMEMMSISKTLEKSTEYFKS